MPLFRRPNVEKLAAQRDLSGLIEALGYQRDSLVRVQATWALERLGDPMAVEPLIDALHDEDRNVRNRAVEALRAFGDARAVAPLIDALHDEDTGVRIEAVQALGAFGDPRAVDPLIGTLGFELLRPSAMTALRRFPDRTASLIGALHDENPDVRHAVVELLPHDDPAAVQPLIGTLADADPDVRQKVVEALDRMGGTRAVDPLIGALHDDSPQVRHAAAEALGRLGDPRAVEPLRAALEDESNDVRDASISALVTLHDARTVTEQAFGLVVDLDDMSRAGDAMATLNVVLERSAPDVDAEVLQLVCALEDGVSYWEHNPSAKCLGSPVVYSEVVGASRVKQLARQELIRRGLRA